MEAERLAGDRAEAGERRIMTTIPLTEKPKPKYKIGQIVVMKNFKREFSFRIIKMYWNDGWFYFWNRKNAASESMIRELTPEEKGEIVEV